VFSRITMRSRGQAAVISWRTALTRVVLPLAVPPATRTLRRARTAAARAARWRGVRIAGLDVLVEGVDDGGGLAEVEDGGGGQRRDEALEPGVAEELQGELGLEAGAGGVEDGR
jgi:hypothetical protein